MKSLVGLGAVVLTTAALAWAGLDDDQPKAGGAPKPVIAEPIKGERCVEPDDYMRRHHMELLLHHRDETVLQGIRTKKYSLKGCVDCHASKKTGSVATAKDDFCVSCHSYAAVKIDCFDCHSTKPESSSAMQAPEAESAHYKHEMDGDEQ
jgi:[DsrC]-trisulfide reductase subunit J